MVNQDEFIQLGRTELRVSRLGLGTWQWGDRIFWDYGKSHNDADLQQAFQLSLRAGINFFDTAEIYGSGRSERLLGEYVSQYVQEPDSQPLVIATKFMPFPWRVWKGAMARAIKGSLERLRMNRVDLYQVHWPMPPMSVETWMEGMADAIRAGQTRAAGVSNYSVRDTKRAHSALQARNISLASNQVEYSLLDRSIEKNGLLSLCQELGITVIAYSPLAKGILSGKYAPDNPPPGIRGRRYNSAYLTKIQSLLQLMREIGEGHTNPGPASPAQVALNWVMRKGAVAIPGAKNARQAEENAGALGWQLSADEVRALDQASDAIPGK